MDIENVVSERCKMLKRIITGAVYVAVVCAFFLLREFVDYRLFNLLTYIWMAVGTFEVARAVKPWAIDGNLFVATVFGIIIAPTYAVAEYFIGDNFGWMVVVVTVLVMIAITGLLCITEKAGGKKFAVSILPFVYPTLFMLTMLLANDLGKNTGFIAMLLIYVIAPLSDTFAYFTGSLIGGKKLCPKLSPKKTWAGAIGGLIGGALGSIAVCLIFKDKIFMSFSRALLLFAFIGVIASILTVIGDLFESFIKRKAGIKDIGNLLPGHGGAMDRMDGATFASVFIYLVFLMI